MYKLLWQLYKNSQNIKNLGQLFIIQLLEVLPGSRAVTSIKKRERVDFKIKHSILIRPEPKF